MPTTVDVSWWAPRLSRSILGDSLRVKRGESVTIEAWTRAVPWLNAFLIEARRIGAYPLVLYNSDEAFWASLEAGKSKNLGTMGPHELAALKETNVYVFFWGPADRIRWHSLPPSQLRTLTAYEEEWFRLANEKRIRFCRIEVTRATERLAKEYGIDLSGWQNELLDASVASRVSMLQDGKKISKRLLKGSRIKIVHPNGTRLELKLKGRKPFVDDGIIDEEDLKAGFIETNVPCGLVAVAVDEEFAEGTIISNQLSRYAPGLGATKGGRWTFRDGRLDEYTFDSGAKRFEKLYRDGGQERDRVGIFSIGLNSKIRDAPLVEDCARGTIAVYVGSNEWVGGSSKGNFHSWVLLRGADVTVDGHTVLRAGKIV